MLRLDGQRIYLRDHQAEDLAAFHAWLSDPVVSRYLSWRTTTLDESLIKLAEAIEGAKQQPRTKYFFAVLAKDTDAIIGEAGFTMAEPVAQGGIADLGYFLLKPYWGQGYASEAAGVMLDFCFRKLKLHKVTASCDAENPASERVMLRCGMAREALRRKQELLDGQWRDRLEYAILVEDWLKNKSQGDPENHPG